MLQNLFIVYSGYNLSLIGVPHMHALLHVCSPGRGDDI